MSKVNFFSLKKKNDNKNQRLWDTLYCVEKSNDRGGKLNNYKYL